MEKIFLFDINRVIFKDLDYNLFIDKMEDSIIFDTKDIIKDVPDEITLFNFGNLYKI